MDEPIILPDDVASALRQIESDGTTATLTEEQLRELKAEAARKDWPSSMPCERHSQSVYIFRGEQILVIWAWRLELGTLKRNPWPTFLSTNSAPESQLRFGPAGELLRMARYGFFGTDNWILNQLEHPKAVLDWLEEWAGQRIRNGFENRGALTDSLCQMLVGVEAITQELREGAELSRAHWFFLGRVRERLSIEAADFGGKSPSDRIRTAIASSNTASKKNTARRKLDRDQIEREKENFLPVAKSLRSSSPTMPRERLAERVMDQLKPGSDGTNLSARAAAARLKELEAEGKLAPNNSTPRTAERRK